VAPRVGLRCARVHGHDARWPGAPVVHHVCAGRQWVPRRVRTSADAQQPAGGPGVKPLRYAQRIFIRHFLIKIYNFREATSLGARLICCWDFILFYRAF
jgi:hypothetical protein